MKTEQIRLSFSFSTPILLILSIFLSSCQTASEQVDIKRELYNSPTAKEYVVTQLEQNKVVFLAEQHSFANPILFLAENLESFYNSGVRYLFLEGQLPLLPNDNQYGFVIFYPWLKAAWKYEWVLLSQAVHRLNSRLPESERLNVIYAEEGIGKPENGHPVTMTSFFQKRDDVASACIINRLNKSAPHEKAIVFYGSSHGSRFIYYNHRRDNLPPFDLKPLGAYLHEKYGDQFYSFTSIGADEQLDQWLNSADRKDLSESGRIAVLAPDLFKGSLIYKNWYSLHDAIIVYPETLYGLYYQYVATTENLRFLFKNAWAYNQIMTGRNCDVLQLPPEEYDYFLSILYYLKYYFGENFTFSFWNGSIPLEEALRDMAEFLFAPGFILEDFSKITLRSVEHLRKYHKTMINSSIETYVYSQNRELLPSIIRAMEEAEALMPEDLWTSYWLNRARTEFGMYQEALEGWKFFLENPLTGCMSVLPEALSMAVICATERSDHETAEKYSVRLDRLMGYCYRGDSTSSN